jgi:hypothetical protein
VCLSTTEKPEPLPLGGSAKVGRNLNLGDFQSRKVELSAEFWLGTSTHEEVYAMPQTKLDLLLGIGWHGLGSRLAMEKQTGV